jgi:outer membrane scaffolding protein for murein synthesis (MipA/OmpV family)
MLSTRSPLRLIAAFAALSPALGVAPLAAQQSEPAPRSPFITGVIGAMALDIPRYAGSDRRWVIPVPVVDLRIAGRVLLGASPAGVGGGAGLLLLDTRHAALSADFSLTEDRPADRTPALAGMSDRGFGTYAGATLLLRDGPFEAQASIAQGLQTRMGRMGIFGVAAGGPLGGRWFGKLGAQTVIGNCDNLRWDFGVTPTEAGRRGVLLAAGAPGLLPDDDVAYDPTCGLRELRANVTLAYGLTQRLSLIGIGSGIRYERGAAESPLIRQRNNWVAGVGLGWRL